MTYESTTTLNRIRAAHPCEPGWGKLLRGLDKTEADDEPFSLLRILDINGLDDALWVMSHAMPDDRLARHFQAWCAEQVLPIFERERPGDGRVRAQIEMLRDDNASGDDRAAAREAAWEAADSAAWEVARAAARAAAREVADPASREAARAAAWEAADSAARTAAREVADSAAREAAREAAWEAAVSAAETAARATQERHLRTMLK